MANLQGTSVSGNLQVNGYIRRAGEEDVSPWWFASHCANATTTAECDPTYACGRLHVRTPLPADISSMGWNPIILEVVGYHSYSGERTSSWKALLNVNGSTNAWYGSQIMVDSTAAGNSPDPSITGGNAADPYVYRSANTYGGKQRVCFAVNKIGCCCTGYIWVRWFNGSQWFNDYPWSTVGFGDSIGSPREAY